MNDMNALRRTRTICSGIAAHGSKSRESQSRLKHLAGWGRLGLSLVMAFLLSGLSLIAHGQAPNARASGPSPHGDMPVGVYLDDLPIAFPISPFLKDGTTMVPLRALSEALGFTVQWHESGTIVCQKGDTSIELTIGSTLVTVNNREVALAQPPQLVDGHTVVPLRFFSEAMDYVVKWDAQSRSALVISPKEKLPVWGFYALGSSEYSSWEDFFGDKYPYPLVPGPDSPASNVAGAILGWFAVDAEGRVTDEDSDYGFRRPDAWGSAMIGMEAGGSQAIAMYFGDNRKGRLSSLLADPLKRERLAMSIASSATSFDGAAIDFEGLGLDPSERERDAVNFTAFLEALRQYLQDRPLMVIVQPLNGHYLGYDHKRIGEIADAVILMAYGYEDPRVPTPAAPWNKVEEAIRLELEQVPAGKLILGVPAYGTLYAVEDNPPEGDGEGNRNPGNTAGGSPTVTLLSRPAARDPVGGKIPAGEGDAGIETASPETYDPYLSCHYSTWESECITYHAFTESNRTLAARASLAKRHGLAGIAIWRLGLLQPGWLDALLEVASQVR